MRTLQVFLALTMVAACGGAGGPVPHPKDATQDSSLSGSGGMAGAGGALGVGTGGSHGTGGAAAAGGNPGTGGTGASSDDGGTVDVSGECGDPVVKASYVACRESKDEATCSERGGTWEISYANTTKYTCVCSTGEGGCPCTASSDCLGHCRAWKDPFGSGAWCQANVTSYTCAAEGGQSDCMCVPYEPFAVCFP
jgi:hypothetical protein